MNDTNIDEQLVSHFLDEAKIPLRLAANTDKGYPALVSLWSLRRNGRIYCATQKQAYIAKNIRKYPAVTFELSCESPPYQGVRGRADARIIPELGKEILEELIAKFLHSKEHPLATKLMKASRHEVAIELTPVWMTTWDYTQRMNPVR